MDICNKIYQFKKNITTLELFHGFPDEFIFIFKNIIKLEFAEEPEYKLYLILLNNILRQSNIDDDIKQKNFVKEKMNHLFEMEIIKDKKNNAIYIKDIILEGYPLNLRKQFKCQKQ